jgi:UDP-glucose 4-epimerase
VSPIQRIVITGSSGCCGRSLIARIRKEAPQAAILGLDVISPKSDCPDEFQMMEIRDPSLVDVIRNFAPDTVVHMAFVVNVTHNDSLMRDININGSRNVFAAVAAVKPSRFLHYSSMTAYGAWADNPIPLDEASQLRGRADFRYAADKTELEGDIFHFASDHPEIVVSWVRPAIVLGPGMQNYLSRYLLDSFFIPLPGGVNSPIQFVHADDLARATWEILARNCCGPFNVCPSNWTTWVEVAQLRNTRCVTVPIWLSKGLMKLSWALRLPALIPSMGCPPGIMNFIRFPWVGTPKRLTEELDFRFQYSSVDTFKLAWEANRDKNTGHRISPLSQ